MLQQTQTARVIPKYEAFVQRFPTVRTLAEAPLHDVLASWQGLGYNQRAKRLRECARAVMERFEGSIPDDLEQLRSLPGIGAYTAGAVLAFAFEKATPFIETNIRTAYLVHFFEGEAQVTDRELLEIVEATLDRSNPREWYYALMDYGAWLKGGVHRNANSEQSAGFRAQSRFVGSRRQLRGAIVRALTGAGCMTVAAVRLAVAGPAERIEECLRALEKDGLIVRDGEELQLAR